MNPTALSTEPALAAEPPKVQNVEDFIPEDGLDRHFLEDTGPPKDKLPVAATPAVQDSDRYSEVTEWYQCWRSHTSAHSWASARPSHQTQGHYSASDHPALPSSDEAVPGGNPMVAGFQDDVDLEDQPPDEQQPPCPAVAASVPQRSSEPEAKRYLGLWSRGGRTCTWDVGNSLSFLVHEGSLQRPPGPPGACPSPVGAHH